MDKVRTALEEMNKDGEFKRKDSVYRDHVTQSGRFKPEAGRYHLYISYACPWANRCLSVLYMKGLEEAIGVSIVHPTWQRTRPDSADDLHTGWTFAAPGDPPFSSPTGHGSFPATDCVPDNINHVKYIRDLYEKVGDTFGKYTVPVLWDSKEGAIVNNESSEIIRMFNSEFNNLAKDPGLDLYPEKLRSAIDGVNEWVYPTINNGVYRCGFATSQKAYEAALGELFASLDRCEEILAGHRYIAGDVLTEADVRLFQTLIRFDHVYVVYFKTNKKTIHEYPNISAYVRDLYHTRGVARSVNLYHIKTHYYTSHPTLNYYAVVPVGPPEWWKEPAPERATKFGTA